MDLNPSNQIAFITEDIRKKNEGLVLAPLSNMTKPKKSFLDVAIDTQTNLVDLQDYSDVKFTDAYERLSDGSYVAKYPSVSVYGGDQEQYFAEKQGTGDKWSNGLLKAGGTALTTLVGGTAGFVNGLVEFAKTGNFQSTYDNDFSKWLDDLNTKWRYELPNYYTQEEREAGFFDSFGSANFWANDVVGGAAFTVGAIGSEALWAWATGGSSLSTTTARLAPKVGKIGRWADDTIKAVNKTKEVMKAPIVNTATKKFANIDLPTGLATNLGKVGEFGHTLRFTMTSAGTEAGMEARHYMREMEDDFYQSYMELNNGQMPSVEEELEFRENLNKSANALYAFNMGVVGASNIAIMGKLFNIKSPISMPDKWANAKLFGVGTQRVDGKLVALTATKPQKMAKNIWGVAKSPIIEGLWEEGLQSVGSNTAKNWVEAGYNPEYTKETFGLGEAFINGFAETYGTKEGWKEVGIGMLIGLFTGTGVNLATGRGIAGEFKNAETEVTNRVNFDKYYSPKKVAEEIAYANRVQEASKNQEVAEAKGDFTSAELSRKSAAIAQLNFGYNLDYFEETVRDTSIAIENIDNESIMKEYGVTEQEAGALREKMVAEYQNTAKTFKKYRQFADYYVSTDMSKEGVSKEEAPLIKQAIAYELTLGSEAYKFSSEILETLKSKIAGGYSDVEITSAMDVDNILLTAKDEVKAEFEQKKKEIIEVSNKKKQLEQERDNLLKVILDESQEQRVSRLAKLNNVEVQLQELSTKSQELEREANATLASAELTNPFKEEKSQQYLTSEQIEKLDENLNKVAELADAFRGADPQKALEIEKLRLEYARSLGAFKRYADLARQLSDPKLGLRGRRNLITELRTDKTPSEITVETLEGLRDAVEILKEQKTRNTLIDLGEVETQTEEEATMKIETVEDLIKKLEKELEKTPPTITSKPQQSNTEAKKADIEKRRQEEKDNTGQKVVQRRLQDLREATSEKQIAQAIINIEKNVKSGAKITKEEQDFVNQKRQELKDKGFEIIDLTGKVWNVGMNLEVLDIKTLEEGTNLTQEEIDVLEKELENRKRKREKLKEKGLSEQEIDNQLEDTINIMTTVQPQLNKDGKMVQAAKVNALQIEVLKAEEILERSKKNPKNTQQVREDKINAKYDAELKALESEGTLEKPNPKYEELKAKIEKLKTPKSAKQTPLEAIKAIIKNNPYLLSYKGEGIPQRPTEQEIGEYYDLATRALSNENFDPQTIGFSGQLQLALTSDVLSAEELERLQELNQKMSDWQLYGGATNSEGLSINDIIEQQMLLEEDIAQEEVVDVMDEEFTEMINPEPTIVDGESIRLDTIVQVYSRVFVKAKKDAYEISNVGVQKFLDGLDIADEVTVTVDGKVNQVNRSEVGKYNTPSHSVTVTFRDGSTATISIEPGGVLKIEEFNKIIENSNYTIDRYTAGKQSGYSVLYQEGVQVESDFKVIDGKLSFTSEELYNMSEDERLTFQVNLNDPYNKKLLNSKKTDEEIAQQLNIYVVDSRGNIVGNLKANRDVTGTPEFLQVRAMASQMIKEETAEAVINLPFEVPISHLFLGVPNLEIEGNVYKTFEIDAKNVVTFGYTQGGDIVLNEKPTQKVRKDLVSKIMKRDGVPIIVFRQGEHLIAYPLTLKKTQKSLGGKVQEILDTFESPSRAVVEINKLLKSQGLSPKSYNIYYTDRDNQTLFNENGTLSDGIQRAISDLDNAMDFVTPQEWNSVEDVVNSANINVDLNNRPLNSPKPVLNFTEMIELKGDWYSEFKRTGEITEEKATEIANKALFGQLTAQEYDASDHPLVVEKMEEIEKMAQQKASKSKNNKQKPCKGKK
jgi:hypothetical protein